MGTILYMAPEQLGDTKSADVRADIFSLGRILCELLTGPLTTATPDFTGLDPAIALVIARCTKQKPNDRFQSVAELKAAWRIALGLEDAGSDSDRLKLLTTKLVDADTETKVLTEFISIMTRHAKDSDLLHEVLIQLPTPTIKALVSVDQTLIYDFLKRFAAHAMAQSWPFTYTEKIASFCERAYQAISDPETRATLLYCVVDIGVGHNRWNVLETARSLLSERRFPAEAIAFAGQIKKASPAIKEWVKNNLSSAKRDTLLENALKMDE